jgi:hypothetical protein
MAGTNTDTEQRRDETFVKKRITAKSLIKAYPHKPNEYSEPLNWPVRRWEGQKDKRHVRGQKRIMHHGDVRVNDTLAT